MRHSGRVNCFNQTYAFYWDDVLLSVYRTTSKRGRPSAGTSEGDLILRADSTRLQANDDRERNRTVRSLLMAQALSSVRSYLISESELVEFENLRRREAGLRDLASRADLAPLDCAILDYVQKHYGGNDATR